MISKQGITAGASTGTLLVLFKGVSLMAKITAKKRKSLPKSSFGLPGKRGYPMHDKAHAANAKARATQMFNKGKLSKSAKDTIHAKANRKLGKKASTSSSSRTKRK